MAERDPYEQKPQSPAEKDRADCEATRRPSESRPPSGLGHPTAPARYRRAA